MWTSIERAREADRGRHRRRDRRRSSCSGWRSRTRWPARSDEALEAGRAALAIADDARPRRHPRERAQHDRHHAPLHVGDPGGVEDQERSIEVARASNSVDVIRSLGNLASCQLDLGQIARGARDPRRGCGRGPALRERLVPRLARAGTRHATSTTRARGTRPWRQIGRARREVRGRASSRSWRGPTGRCERVSASREVTWTVRSKTSERTRDLARLAKNPQLLHTGLASFALRSTRRSACSTSRLRWSTSSSRTGAHIRFLRLPSGCSSSRTRSCRCGRARRAGRGARRRSRHDAVGRRRTRIRRGGSAGCGRRSSTGWKHCPKPPTCASSPAASAEVRRALEFYRSVGATRYVAEGEAMLATSRSA